jgi:hypothetical protein
MARRLASLLVAVFLLLTTAVPAVAAGPSTWHRVNPYAANGPEHERLICGPATVGVACRYDKLHEPRLDFAWDTTKGTFHGGLVSGWITPAWFPAQAADAAAVYGGAAIYYPAGGAPFSVDTRLVFATDGTLYVYWVDQFVCPWYSTFSQALDHDPSCTDAP